jgi:hypothetical protein
VDVSARNRPDGDPTNLPFTSTARIVDAIHADDAPPPLYLARVSIFSGYVAQVETRRPEGVVTLTLQGWEGRIREDVATSTSKYGGSQTVVQVIDALIARTFDVPAALTISHGAGLDTTTLIEPGYTIAPGDDVLQHILDLAKSIGAECYGQPSDWLDEQTVFRLQPVPGAGDYPNTENLATPETVLVDSIEGVRRAVNRARIRYEPAQPTAAKPARTGVADITSGPQDPDSMGRVTEWQRRTGYRTAAVANTAAARLLRQRSRRTRSVSWSQVPAPWVAPGDTVPVRTLPLEEFPTATTRSLVVNRLTYPCASDALMTVVARGDYA